MSRAKKNENEATPVAEPAEKNEQKLDPDVVVPAEPQGEGQLNGVEELKLVALEEYIKLNLYGFMIVGKALKAISDEKLYRVKFKRFEDYCQERWGLSDKYAYRQIEAYICVDRLEKALSPIGEKRIPTNESQVRPLTALEPEQQVKAWQRVLKAREGKSITADDVEKVVDKMLGQPGKAKATTKTQSKKVEQTLVKIGKLVTKALEDDSELTVPKLKQILEKIQKMIGTKK